MNTMMHHKNMIIFVYKKCLNSEKTNDPVCILVSKSSKVYSKCVRINQKHVRRVSRNPMMGTKIRSYPLLDRLYSIINSSFSTASLSSSQSSPSNEKACGEIDSLTGANARPTNVSTSGIDRNQMSDFEYEDFSLDSLDSIFEESAINPAIQDIPDASNTNMHHPFSSDNAANTSSSIPNLSFCDNAKDNNKYSANYNSFPHFWQNKQGKENMNGIPTFLPYNESGLDHTSAFDSVTMNSHQNNITMNNHCSINNNQLSHNESMLELQPPPFALDSLQSPVTDMPGFEWSSALDWTESTPYENANTAPCLPYSAYHTHNNPHVVENSSRQSHIPTTSLGPIPPLELITPSSTTRDEKFLYPGFPQDLPLPSTEGIEQNNDFNVLGVDLNNLMLENAHSSQANARLLTDIATSSLSINDDHFTPPPSPIESKSLGNGATYQKEQYKPHPRKKIVISSSQISTNRKSKKVAPREVKANHMDCHDYTNKVQYTKTTPMSNISPIKAHLNLSNDGFPNSLNCDSRTAGINMSLNHRCSYKKTIGIINRVEDIRKKISEIDDPEYLAHGTGIPR